MGPPGSWMVGSAGGHAGQQPLGGVGEAVVDLYLVAVGPHVDGRREVMAARVADHADDGAEREPEQDAVADQAEDAAAVEREQQGEEQAPGQSEQRALAGAVEGRAGGGPAPGHLFDVAQAGADDGGVLDREPVIGEPVDGALGAWRVGGGGDGPPARDQAGGRRGSHVPDPPVTYPRVGDASRGAGARLPSGGAATGRFASWSVPFGTVPSVAEAAEA